MAIVSLSVRFRSMTVDEFIEHEAHNVSAQGIYLQTAHPSPLDTLVQLQVRLTSGQHIIAGIGRVVWRRDVAQVSAGRAPGMGVKFVKLDERSRAFVSHLVTETKEAGRAYEEEAEQTATLDEAPPAAQWIAAKKTTSRPPAAPSADASLIERIRSLRRPGAESSAPPPKLTPPSRPAVERPPSSIPSAPAPPARSTGRPVPRDPRS
jgi:uncharacterized protein (TIGR02266 family)